MRLFSTDLALSDKLPPGIIVRNFLHDPELFLDYESTWRAMQHFVRQRDQHSTDEIWLLQHAPVYTLGQAGDPAHILNSNSIPVVKVDRGGQVTYHGPGQIMFYTLVNLKRYQLSVRDLVKLLEDSVIELLSSYGVDASGDRDAPGVYVGGQKIAALGLRISRGFSYHGLCLNVAFDATPFDGINPCGYRDLRVTQLAELLPASTVVNSSFFLETGEQLKTLFVGKLTRLLA